jgi:integrase
VLPARRITEKRRFRHISPDTPNVALARVKHGLEHFTVHDMRRTARTQLAALGIPSELAERALNHKLKGIEGTYNRHDYFDERKQALVVWADLLSKQTPHTARRKVKSPAEAGPIVADCCLRSALVLI